MRRVQATIENIEIENWQADKYAALLAKVTLSIVDLTSGIPIEDCVFTVPVAEFQQRAHQERQDFIIEIATQHIKRCLYANAAVDPKTGTWTVGEAYIKTQFTVEV